MRTRVIAVAVLAAAVLTGCTTGKNSSAAPTSTASAAPTTSRPATPTPSPTPTAAALPQSCQEALPQTDMDTATGVFIIGRTHFLEDIPEPKIHRTGRIDCQFGLITQPNGKTSDPRLELSISAYTDAASAGARIQVTVSAYRDQGAVPTPVIAGGYPATILTGVGPPTLVVATGTRTIAVSLANGVVPAAKVYPALIAVAVAVSKHLP